MSPLLIGDGEAGLERSLTGDPDLIVVEDGQNLHGVGLTVELQQAGDGL